MIFLLMQKIRMDVLNWTSYRKKQGCGITEKKLFFRSACILAPVAVSVLFLALVCGVTQADFIQVTTSSAAPQGLGSILIQDISNRYLAQVTKNPLASNTWSVKLQGVNPNFNGPPTTLDQALTLGSTVYLYGYRDGARYDQDVQINLVGNFDLNCSTPMPNVPAWDAGTCQAVTGAISAEIYKQIGSTITIIPGY